MIQAEVGVELVKGRRAVLDVGARATALIGKDSDGALVSGISGAVAF